MQITRESGSSQRSLTDFEWLRMAYVQAQENADMLKRMYVEATREINKINMPGKEIKELSCQQSQ